MQRFNLNDYETVEERIRRFDDENPDGRITTENLTTQVDTWHRHQNNEYYQGRVTKVLCRAKAQRGTDSIYIIITLVL